ncbi:Nucleolar protein 10 [Amphibalanus amphitrite]|uniref:Nucleolar protein 10 n=1 Tax=Amphibalanus amphitrite TaxID=1232801 RepID=A0A6A4W3Q0_AMPAM|nr:Nucleolar protein 10 [Amphibalanus amphitrite]
MNGGLQIGVGLSTGQVLLYDIRSDKPLLVKDHYNELPIKDIRFHSGMDLVMSMDSKVVKIWEKESGKPKVQTYYIPSIGPAPKWCNFLDNLTEELEESDVTTIYDNYKFVTRQELDDLGLTHLLGTNLLRAYMHGFFVDIRLYKKAKSVADPFAFDDYRKKKIKEKLDAKRDNRVKLDKLPSVNKDIALKLMHGAKIPDFTVDRESDTFRLLNPVLSSLEEQRAAKAERRQRLAEERRLQEEHQRQEELEPEGRPSSEEEDDDEDEDSSDGEGYVTERQRRQQQRQLERRQRPAELVANPAALPVRVLQGDSVREITGGARRERRVPLGERLRRQQSDGPVQHVSGFGNRQMTFTLAGKKKRDSRRREEALRHHAERRKIRRSASSLGKTAGAFKNA